MSFSENLVKLQKEKGVSDYRLAKELQVSPTTIVNWKNGSSPSIKKAHRVASYFEKTVDEMMK
ncbi:MAG: helix-turn-helix transcriptional regulator [Oscillospiraceae bacterium]|nr:helix-turn-helix transcriptional regulator [Oscillospiraceae bacterium]